MVRVLMKRAFNETLYYCEFAGLSSDDKPLGHLVTGSKFVEVDTGDLYRYDETSSGTWYKNPPDPEGD